MTSEPGNPLFRVVAAVVALLVVGAAASAQDSPIPQLGPRPPQSIHDPGGVLSPGWTGEIAAKLPEYLERDGIDIIVVILDSLGHATPDHVARLYSRAWCHDTPLYGIILHVPGNADSPWIHVGGPNHRAISDPESARATLEAARRRAMREADNERKIRAAVVETADILRFWTGGARQRTELILRERERLEAAHARRQRVRRLLLPVLMLGTVSLCILLLWRPPRAFQRKQRMFPRTRVKPRLGAPHAGGNQAVRTADDD
jgi:uncharacterized membrane protein YgcG